MASVKDTATFFSEGTASQFQHVLSLYPQVLRLKAESKNKKPEDLEKLDNWWVRLGRFEANMRYTFVSLNLRFFVGISNVWIAEIVIVRFRLNLFVCILNRRFRLSRRIMRLNVKRIIIIYGKIFHCFRMSAQLLRFVSRCDVMWSNFIFSNLIFGLEITNIIAISIRRVLVPHFYWMSYFCQRIRSINTFYKAANIVVNVWAIWVLFISSHRGRTCSIVPVYGIRMLILCEITHFRKTEARWQLCSS